MPFLLRVELPDVPGSLGRLAAGVVATGMSSGGTGGITTPPLRIQLT